MKTLEDMQAYIDRTQGNFERYTMSFEEMILVVDAYQDSLPELVLRAFTFGRAKGYRAAKVEQRKEKKGATA